MQTALRVHTRVCLLSHFICRVNKKNQILINIKYSIILNCESFIFQAKQSMHVFAWCMLAEALEPTGNFFLKKVPECVSVFTCKQKLLSVSRCCCRQ